MKRAFIAVFAALLAVAASAITATKEYVDRKDADKRDKTDLTVYEKTVLGSDWSFVCHLADECQPVLVNGVEPNFYDVIFTPPQDEGGVELCSMGIWGNVELGSGLPDGEIIFDPRNGLPTSARLPYAATFGGKSYKVGEWPRLKTFSIPTDDKLATTGDIDALTPEKLGAFPAADGRQLAAQVSAQGAFLNAEDARFVSTNYDSKVRLPEAYFEIKLPSGEWARMWSEMTRWNWFLEGIYSPWTNAVAAALSTKGEKEWGFFDAATGAPAPDGFLWVSMPRIAICAGAAYQRIAEAQGSYWVLESNGMVAELSGNTNGYFRIVDDEGKAQFEIIKGDKMTVYAAPSTFTSSIMGVKHYHVTYKVQNAAEAPKAEFKRNLTDEGWLREGEAGCPCNVSWTKRDDSTYECEWWPIGNEPRMFMQAAFQVGGETRIRQIAPVEMEKITIGGKTYPLTVSEINGKKVLTLE